MAHLKKIKNKEEKDRNHHHHKDLMILMNQYLKQLRKRNTFGKVVMDQVNYLI